MKPFLKPSLTADTDSYKLFHEPMYPVGTTNSFCYGATRTKGEMINFFGLQPLIIHKLINNPVTKGDIDEMVDLVPKHIGLDKRFLQKGWEKVVNVHGGYAPLHIRAVNEGTIMPSNLAMFTVKATDPDLFWLPGYIEPWMERTWSTITAGTKSWRIKQMLLRYLDESSDNPDVIDYMLHDFGCRGGDSEEAVALIGGAFLQHFKGTDTIPALRMLREYYGADCAGYSVPASEHSVMGARGIDGEREQWNHIWDTFGVDGGKVSIVGDTYSISKAVNVYVREMRDKIIDSGATLIIRPDSSRSLAHTCSIITDLLADCANIFDNVHTNSKGFKVLPKCVKILWGDGNNYFTICEILRHVLKFRWSAENLLFGIGGELHAKQDRDMHKFAYKSSAQERNGIWYDVFKDPDTDPGKVSYQGRISTFRTEGGLKTLQTSEAKVNTDFMKDVYCNGKLLRFQTLDEIREITKNVFE